MIDIKDVIYLLPGFRSKTSWKMRLAKIYYLLCILSMLDYPAYSLIVLSLPIMVLSIPNILKVMPIFMDAVRNKNENRFAINKALLPFCLASLLFLIGLLVA